MNIVFSKVVCSVFSIILFLYGKQSMYLASRVEYALICFNIPSAVTSLTISLKYNKSKHIIIERVFATV